ncbi:MAG: hypothetical protein SGJ05_03175 [bacterium]|nr:hypothetical protein [bacterium]
MNVVHIDLREVDSIMHRHVFIVLISCILSVVSLSAQDPVAFDGSRAKEMQIAWTRTATPSALGAYMQNVADIPGYNIVTMVVNGVPRTWPTTPLLDTTARTINWISHRPNYVVAYDIAAPFDYDGIPPMEIFSGRNIFRPSPDGKVITAIDSVDCFGDNPDFDPYRYRVDVDGNGLLDIAAMTTGGSGKDYWFSAIMNGAGRTNGCGKVVLFPNIYKNREQPERESTPVRIMRCADGKLRIVYVGSIHPYLTGIYLLDVNIVQTDTGYAVRYTMADSSQQRWSKFGGEDPWIIRPLICVDDQKNGHQYALVNWQDGWHRNHNTTVLYEVSNGKLIERVSTVGHIIGTSIYTFDNAFDDGEAVVFYGKNFTPYFARISEFYRPFAKIPLGVYGRGWAFIDDQFGDGRKDLLCATDSTISLVNFDLTPTNVMVEDAGTQEWVSLESGRLRLSLERPSVINVDLVNAIGQKRPVIAGFSAPSGPSMLDISAQLQSLPPGAWFVRVSDGVRIVSLSYLR